MSAKQTRWIYYNPAITIKANPRKTYLGSPEMLYFNRKWTFLFQYHEKHGPFDGYSSSGINDGKKVHLNKFSNLFIMKVTTLVLNMPHFYTCCRTAYIFYHTFLGKECTEWEWLLWRFSRAQHQLKSKNSLESNGNWYLAKIYISKQPSITISTWERYQQTSRNSSITTNLM